MASREAYKTIFGRIRNALDIGCGDGYFLKSLKCREAIGLDQMHGDHILDRLEFPDDKFDVVIMLAVIEHISDLEPSIKEIARVLKPGKSFVFTRPKEATKKLILRYSKEDEDDHDNYFDLESIEALSRSDFELDAFYTFIFGLNQVFCLKDI